jgi:SAM-dependent methyltransferase
MTAFPLSRTAKEYETLPPSPGFDDRMSGVDHAVASVSEGAVRMVRDVEAKTAITQWYDDLAARWPTHAPPGIQTFITAQVGCAPGSLILDAGCGNGVRCIPLARAGYRVHGIDLSPEMIAVARQTATGLGLGEPDARFAVGDVERLPVADALCDAVLCVNVLDFTPHPGIALAEFARVLRPGGRLVLSMLGAHSAVKRGPGSERWRRFLPGAPAVIPLNDILPWEMEALLGALGWQILDQRPHVGPTVGGPPSLYTLAMVLALPDRILQQTAATTWQFVAVRPVGTSHSDQ